MSYRRFLPQSVSCQNGLLTGWMQSAQEKN
nr:MAG TPA: hypothetical protein [Caudoviricetes sp.]